MSLIQIAWRNFCHRSLSSILTTLSLALGVGLVVIVLSVYGVISEAFTRNASVGYNMVIGPPKGSALQLVLNSVYYLSQPAENLPFTEYMEFLDKEQRTAMVESFGGDGALAERGGRYAPYVAGGYAIPLALGDYFGEFRVVGTTPEFFEKLRHGPNVDQPFAFSQGRAIQDHSDEHGYFEAVVGSRVASEMFVSDLLQAELEKALSQQTRLEKRHGGEEGLLTELEKINKSTVTARLKEIEGDGKSADEAKLLKQWLMHSAQEAKFKKQIEDAGNRTIQVGDKIFPTHGDPSGHGHDLGFTIVGVMKPTGTPNDRAAFVNLEGFYLMDGHAKPIEDDEQSESDESESDEKQPADAQSDAAVIDVDQASGSTNTEPNEPESKGPDRFRLLSIPEREVTSILIRNGDIMFALGMQNAINERFKSQAAAPIGEISKLMSAIVGPLMEALLAITIITCIVAAVGILVSIYNSMNDRRRDIAVMRALGARRQTVTTIIICESLLIAVFGAVLGWVLAHLAIVLYSGQIEAQTGVQVGFFTTSYSELYILPLVLVLALIAALLPAWSAYRTDVGSNLAA